MSLQANGRATAIKRNERVAKTSVGTTCRWLVARTRPSARGSSGLTPKGVLVPPGFATTAAAYREYVEANGIAKALAQRLEALESGKASLHDTGEVARR